MKATPLVVNIQEKNAPIYSTHFEPHGKGRLATAGGDNNVRVRIPYIDDEFRVRQLFAHTLAQLWKVDVYGENRHLLYLTTLIKHTQAVNVVRFSPRGKSYIYCEVE